LIELTDEMTEALAGALVNRTPVIMSYVDADGQPHISFRGTVQVYSPDQLAVWARNPDGGLPNAVGASPQVALLYRDPESRTAWQFLGRARIEDDEDARNVIFDASPEFERDRDPERKGKALVIDVDKVVGRDLLMERDA
jgi:hypothetical protein